MNDADRFRARRLTPIRGDEIPSLNWANHKPRAGYVIGTCCPVNTPFAKGPVVMQCFDGPTAALAEFRRLQKAGKWHLAVYEVYAVESQKEER